MTNHWSECSKAELSNSLEDVIHKEERLFRLHNLEIYNRIYLNKNIIFGNASLSININMLSLDIDFGNSVCTRIEVLKSSTYGFNILSQSLKDTDLTLLDLKIWISYTTAARTVGSAWSAAISTALQTSLVGTVYCSFFIIFSQFISGKFRFSICKILIVILLHLLMLLHHNLLLHHHLWLWLHRIIEGEILRR